MAGKKNKMVVKIENATNLGQFSATQQLVVVPKAIRKGEERKKEGKDFYLGSSGVFGLDFR